MQKLKHHKKNAEALSDSSKEIGPELNTEKIKYMFMPRQHTAGQNHDTKVANKSFKKWQT
jgi:hypothetical protein